MRLQGRASQLQPEAAGLGACHAGYEGRAHRPSRQRLQGWPAPRKAAGSARETENSEGAGAQKHRRAARPPAQQAHHQVLPGVADGLLDELQRRDPASHQEGLVSSSGTARLTAPGRGLVLLSMGGGAHSRLARHRRCLVYARQVLRPLYSSSAAGPHLASASLRQSRSSCEQAAAVDASCVLTLGALLARLICAKHMHGSTVLALFEHKRGVLRVFVRITWKQRPEIKPGILPQTPWKALHLHETCKAPACARQCQQVAHGQTARNTKHALLWQVLQRPHRFAYGVQG